jgi:endonuclease/exonuclease/phosphatase family metal-dependent hydrolase
VRVTTWNVLHRVHAMNWGEGAVAAFPEERVRAVAVAESVASWLSGDTDVVCLQEVSGDQLACVREAVGPDVQVLHHRYPRVPRLRRPARSAAETLCDPSEHLVVLVKARAAHVRAARTFESDPGKGLLAVEVGDELLVVDTHVSWGPRAGAQLALLAETALAVRPIAAVMGDFNAPVDEVARGLGPDFAPPPVIGPTRLASSGEGAKTIDHVFVRGGALRSIDVLDAGGLSDHLPVTAELVRG